MMDIDNGNIRHYDYKYAANIVKNFECCATLNSF